VQRLADDYRQFRQAQRTMRALCKELTELTRELEGLLCEDPFQEQGKR
jgi:hypothetical protein